MWHILCIVQRSLGHLLSVIGRRRLEPDSPPAGESRAGLQMCLKTHLGSCATVGEKIFYLETDNLEGFFFLTLTWWFHCWRFCYADWVFRFPRLPISFCGLSEVTEGIGFTKSLGVTDELSNIQQPDVHGSSDVHVVPAEPIDSAVTMSF